MKTGPWTSVFLDCMDCSLVSARRLLCCYVLVNISANICRAAFWEHKRGFGLALCSTETRRKESDPQPEIQRQVLKGAWPERGSASWGFDVCSGFFRPEAPIDVEKHVCYLLPSILHGYLLHLASQSLAWATAGLRRDRRLQLLCCFPCCCFSLSISPSYYLLSSLLLNIWILWVTSLVFIFIFCIYLYLSQPFCLFTSYFALYSFFKNESARAFFGGSVETRTDLYTLLSW